MAMDKHATMGNHATVEAFSLWSVPVMTSLGVFFGARAFMGQLQLRVSIRAEQQSSEKSCRVAGEQILRYWKTRNK
jgi:hypothetical protein